MMRVQKYIYDTFTPTLFFHCLCNPGQESSEPGVDPRVALPGTALAPADDSYLRVRSVLAQHSQGSPRVSLTSPQPANRIQPAATFFQEGGHSSLEQRRAKSRGSVSARASPRKTRSNISSWSVEMKYFVLNKLP